MLVVLGVGEKSFGDGIGEYGGFGSVASFPDSFKYGRIIQCHAIVAVDDSLERRRRRPSWFGGWRGGRMVTVGCG